MKKLSLTLALLMAAALCAPAFATSYSSGTSFTKAQAEHVAKKAKSKKAKAPKAKKA